MQCYAWGIDEYIYPWFVVVVESGGHYSLAHTNVSAKQPDINSTGSRLSELRGD